MACEAGANWIQYRCLTKADNELIAEIHQVASICDDWGATLILTDHYHLLDKVDAQGVHIEDMEADFKSIRKQIGEDKTLGASAHSFEDIQRISESGVVDYVGCGPFSITETKPNNYRLLGLEGYRILIQQMAAHKIDIPVLAVGGVNIDDTKALSDTGVYGVAVSGAVNMAKDPATAIKAFRNILY
ncbi:MAG TPA: thiamine phosphate synthase [Sphingobacteriaceae bacterium]|nr:thiamine phosphate synthase [Sphingobacteriaceae bacterium]